jgi:hypothetical protein
MNFSTFIDLSLPMHYKTVKDESAQSIQYLGPMIQEKISTMALTLPA